VCIVCLFCVCSGQIVDMIVSIAKLGTKQAVEVTQLAYRLLKQMSKRNTKNALHIIGKLPLEYVVKVAMKEVRPSSP